LQVKSQTDNSGSNNGVCIHSPEELREIIRLLKTNYSERVVSLQSTFIINNIEQFAKEIRKFAAVYKLDIITEWGDELGKAVESFDMEKIIISLSHFNKLVEKLESRLIK